MQAAVGSGVILTWRLLLLGPTLRLSPKENGVYLIVHRLVVEVGLGLKRGFDVAERAGGCERYVRV